MEKRTDLVSARLCKVVVVVVVVVAKTVSTHATNQIFFYQKCKFTKPKFFEFFECYYYHLFRIITFISRQHDVKQIFIVYKQIHFKKYLLGTRN